MKSPDIADLIFCKINGIAPSFSLVLPEVYSEPCHTSKIERSTNPVGTRSCGNIGFLLDFHRNVDSLRIGIEVT